MPKLPGVDDIDRPNVQESSRPGSSVQSDAWGSGLSALGRGLSSMGTDLGRIAGDARRKAETETRQINGANADAYMLQRISERERELRDNPDKWEEWKQGNVGWVTKVTNEAAAYVGEKERPVWMAQRNLRNQQVLATFESNAREKHRDSYVAQTIKMTEENRKLILDPNTPPERVNEIINATRAQFDQAASLGFMSKEQAQKNGEQWRNGTALEWLKLQPPEKRIEQVGRGSFKESLKRGDWNTPTNGEKFTAVDIEGRPEPANFKAIRPEVQDNVRNLATAFGGNITITPHGGTQSDKRAPTSQHHHGTAIDINIQKMSDEDKTRLIATAVAQGAKGFGAYSVGQGVGTIHVDWRGEGQGKGPGGLSVWHRQGFGKDAGVETAPTWFQEGIKRGLEWKAQGGPPQAPATAGAAPPDMSMTGEAGAFQTSLKTTESTNNPGAHNGLGYVGLYQFGADRLRDLGLYKGGAKGNDWSGQFNIPGFPNVKTLEDFKANKDAQEAAAGIHFNEIDKFIASNGLEKYIGQRIAGTVISKESMYAVAHLGGNGGLKQFLETNGAYNPGDGPDKKGGTRLSDYARRFSNVGSGMGQILPENIRVQVRSGAYTEMQQTRDVEAATMRKAITSDLAGIETTGKGLEESNISFERIQQALGADAANQWLEQRGRAARVFEAMNGIENASDAEIQRRLERLRPQTEPVADGPVSSFEDAKNLGGNVKPGYAEDLKAYQEAQKRVANIMQQRAADPAQAVERHEKVQEARNSIAKEDIIEGPEGQRGLAPRAIQQIIAARMAAQADLGIPVEDRLALARRDTVNIAKQLRLASVDESGGKILEFVTRLQATYGDWTDEVLAAVMHFNNGFDRETSATIGGYIRQLGSGVRLGILKQDITQASIERSRFAAMMLDTQMPGDQPAVGVEKERQTRRLGIASRTPKENASTPGENKPTEKPSADPAKAPDDTGIDIDPNDLELFLKKNTPDIEKRFRAKYGNKKADDSRKAYVEGVLKLRNTK